MINRLPRRTPVPTHHPGPVLDVVVPVFNEETDLEPNVRRLHAHLSEAFPYPFRITVADNASTDRTPHIAARLAAELPGTEWLRLPEKGRGRALRAAWSQSSAPVLAYVDVDLSTELAALLPLVAPLISGHSDLAIGTRLAPASRVVRGPRREVTSRCYNALLRSTLAVGFSDAQCGFKAVRRDVAEVLLPLVEDTGWFFDTELLVIAERAGLRIHEVPVDWVDDPDSRVDLLATALADLRGIARLGGALARGTLPPAVLRLAPDAPDALAEQSAQPGRAQDEPGVQPTRAEAGQAAQFTGAQSGPVIEPTRGETEQPAQPTRADAGQTAQPAQAQPGPGVQLARVQPGQSAQPGQAQPGPAAEPTHTQPGPAAEPTPAQPGPAVVQPTHPQLPQAPRLTRAQAGPAALIPRAHAVPSAPVSGAPAALNAMRVPAGPAAQLARFAAIGAMSTVGHLLLYAALSPALGAQAANALALLLCALANTAANRRLTFGHRGRGGALRHHGKGLVVFLIGLALTSGSLAFLHHAAPSAGHATDLAVLLAANLTATVLRFLLLRAWVFRV
ncbi:glycosyltransferase [Streptomyces sp. cg40]|uniref:glycosyltransferase n=1 Tax=Streptomyces sp. cg40 TaxID=3419764 RepID=UPI003CFF89CA